ncbi:MAG: hypothetical protein ACHQPI_11535 [Thermoanaerobaculia bacterium]
MSLAAALFAAGLFAAIHIGLRRSRPALRFQLAVDLLLLLFPGRVLLSGAHLGPGPLFGESWGTVRTVSGSPDQVDLPTQLHVWWEEVRRLVASGEPPWISDRIGGGLPLFSEGQTCLLFPPHLPVWLFGPENGTDVMALLKLEAAALGMYFLSRRLGLRPAAAAVGGIAWGFGLPLLTWLVSPMGWVYASAPWALSLLFGALRGSGRSSAALALLFGTLLGGGVSPEAAGFLFLATALAGLVLGWGKLRRIGRAAAPLGLALLVSAVGLLPVLMSIPRVLASDTSVKVGPRSSVLLEIVASTLFVPWRHGHPTEGTWRQGFAAAAIAFSVGTAAWALAVAAFPRRRHRRAALAFLSIGLLGTGFLFVVPGFREIFLALPLFPKLIWHRAGFLLGFAVVLLASLGADAWLRRRRGGLLIPAAVLLGFAVALLLATSPVRPESLAAILPAAAPVFLIGAALVGRRTGGVALPVAVAVEVCLIGWKVLAASVPAAAPPAVEELRHLAAPGERILGYAAALPPNIAARLGLSDLRANDPVAPLSFRDLQRALVVSDPLLGTVLAPWSGFSGAWGVGWMVSFAPLPEGAPFALGWVKAADVGSGAIYRNPRRLGTVRLAVVERVSTGRWDAACDAADFSREAVVERPLGLVGTGRLEVLDARPSRVSTRVVCEGRCLAILQTPLAPGWTGLVDGAVSPIVVANVAGMGIVVAGGTHEVSWRYSPPGLAPGAAATLLGLAGCIILVRAKRRSS